MTKTFFFTLCFLLSFSKSIGQVIGDNLSVFDPRNMSVVLYNSNSTEYNGSAIEGSPYINNNIDADHNLPIAKFYSPDFKHIETALARYNAFTDDIVVSLLNDGVNYSYLRKKPNFFYIMLGKTTYRAYEFKNDLNFFVIVSKNDKEKCSLLKKEKIVFKKEEKASSSFVTGTPSKYRRLKDIYYFKLESSIKEIPKKKKQLHNLFGEKNSEMKEFIKATKLNLSKEEDLLRISEYYNSLLD